MDDRKAYWFEQPYIPGALNIAVSPIIDPRDGRLMFRVPGDEPPWSGIWQLTGKVTKDTGDYFEFECNDSVMGARGGTYKFSALDIKTFRKETCKWIAQGKEIAECCQNTADLHFWYRKNWPNPRVYEIGEWEMKKEQSNQASVEPIEYQEYASEAEEYADLMTDNRLAELSEMNTAALADMLQQMDTGEIPLEMSGYTEEDLEDLLNALGGVDTLENLLKTLENVDITENKQ